MNRDYIYTTARLMLLNSAYYEGVVGDTHLCRWWQCGWYYSPLQMMAVWLVLLTSTDDGSVVGITHLPQMMAVWLVLLTSADDSSVVGVTYLCR